jgi:hypothetical protein
LVVRAAIVSVADVAIRSDGHVRLSLPSITSDALLTRALTMPLGHWLERLRHGLIRTHRDPKPRVRRRAAPDWTAAQIQPLEPRVMLSGTNEPPTVSGVQFATDVELSEGLYGTLSGSFADDNWGDSVYSIQLDYGADGSVDDTLEVTSSEFQFYVLIPSGNDMLAAGNRRTRATTCTSGRMFLCGISRT